MFRLFLSLIFLSVATVTYLYNDNARVDKAISNEELTDCLKIKHTFLKARCYQIISEIHKENCNEIPHDRLKKECFDKLYLESDLVKGEILKPNFKGVLTFFYYLIFLNVVFYLVFSFWSFSINPRLKIYFLADVFERLFNRKGFLTSEVLLIYFGLHLILIILFGFLEFSSAAIMI